MLVDVEVLHRMKFSDANGHGANNLSNADSVFVGDFSATAAACPT